MLALILSVAGVTICVLSVFKAAHAHGRDIKQYSMIAGLGLFVMIVGMALTAINYVGAQETIQQNIAKELRAEPDKIIIEDLTRKSLLASISEGQHLQEIYYDGSRYVVELNGTTVKTLAKKSDSTE